MSDQPNKPEEEFVDDTYAQRIANARDESQAKLFEEKKKSKAFQQSENEKTIAKSLISLHNNGDFKTFLDYENLQMSATIINSTVPPPKDVFPSTDYGLQMAFNAGRKYQMAHVRNERNQLMKVYLNNNQIQKKEDPNGEH